MRSECSTVSFWTASARECAGGLGARVYGGKSARPRLKSGEGKTVRDLVRMFVIVSSLARWGLNWYLPSVC